MRGPKLPWGWAMVMRQTETSPVDLLGGGAAWGWEPALDAQGQHLGREAGAQVLIHPDPVPLACGLLAA